MPILFKTSYRYSPISGLGLFADEDIPEGEVWWINDPKIQGVHCQNAPNLPNVILGKQDVQEYIRDKSSEQLAQIIEHTMYYPDADKLIVLRDGSGCINHSFEPNSQIVYNKENDCTKLHSKTQKKIKAGEEITENYGNYCKISGNWAEEFFRKHMPSRLEFEAAFDIKKVSS